MGVRHLLVKMARRAALTSENPAELRRRADALLRIAVAVEDKIRRLDARSSKIPGRRSVDGDYELKAHIQEANPPWNSLEIIPNSIPGMISDEERRYYQYLAGFFSGGGEVVELGPWLGCSTFHITAGLEENPEFQGKKLWVYDDFVWRTSFMNQFVDREDQLADGDDFKPLFERFTASIGARLHTEKRTIGPEAFNDGIPGIDWNGAPVEILFVDCGRTFSVNEAWFRLFLPFFVPDLTLIVMQDWRLHREIPVKWQNQTRQFTESKGSVLQLVHELEQGGTATFLYRGGDIPSYA